MILNANTFHAPNALSSAGMLQSSGTGVGGPSKLSSEHLGSVGSDLLNDPSGTVLSPSNSASSLTSTGVCVYVCVCICVCMCVYAHVCVCTCATVCML